MPPVAVPESDGMLWVWDGKLAVVNVVFSVPPVVPKAWVVSSPIIVRPFIFGKLNVVLPLPVPYVVPIVLNKLAYVVLDTALPSQGKYPPGTVELAFILIIPGSVGSILDTV